MYIVVAVCIVFALPACVGDTWTSNTILSGFRYNEVTLTTNGRCLATEITSCPIVDKTALQATCVATPTIAEPCYLSSRKSSNHGRPIQSCLGIEIGKLRPTRCVYTLTVDTGVPPGTVITFSLNGTDYNTTLVVGTDAAPYDTQFTIPHNAFRYNQNAQSAVTPVTVRLAGPTVRDINAHFLSYNISGYICCNSAIAATNNVVVTSTDRITTLYAYQNPIKFRGKILSSIPRISDVSGHTVSPALDPVRTTTNPGTVTNGCRMSPLFDVETAHPYAICNYNADMSHWTPESLELRPVTEVILTYSVLKDGPPIKTNVAAFTAWQGVALNKYTHSVHVFPWTVAAPGFGATTVTQQTHACAQTGCRIEIHTHTPAPRFTNQFGGGANGFSMIGEFKIGSTLITRQTQAPTAHPVNLTTSEPGITPNPLFCIWYTTYVFELVNITDIVTANAFVDWSANFYGTYWDYSSVWAQGWQPPTPSSAASHQYQLKLTFYDPAQHNSISSAMMTLNPTDSSLIDFQVKAIKGLAVVSFPFRPVLFPSFRFKRSGDDTAEFTLDGESPIGVQYSIGSFSSAGVYTGRINISALIHNEFAPRYDEVLQVGATLMIRMRPPYFEGGQTPGGAWLPGATFATPLEKTFTITPRYAAVTINCTVPGSGVSELFSRTLDVHMLCVFDLDTTRAILIPRLVVNATTTAKTSHEVYTADFGSNCTTHNVSNTGFSSTRCTIAFAHQFEADADGFIPQVFTQTISSGIINRFDVGTFGLETVPNIIQHAVTINASVIILKNFDTLLDPFQLTTPVSQLTTQTVTANPNLTVTLQYLPDETELTLHFPGADPNITKVGTGVYTLSIKTGMGYTELSNRTAVVITVSVPWWTGKAWTFPANPPGNWPVLSTTLQIRKEAEVASLVVPITTPAPDAIPEGTLFVSSRLSGTHIALLTTMVALSGLIVVATVAS